MDSLVLLPGILADVRLFLPQLTALGRERPVVAAPTSLGERIDEIASGMLPSLPGRFALAGHGFGGMIAMELCRRAPERVTKLMLMSTSPLPETPNASADRELRILAARAGRFDDAIRAEIPAQAIAETPERSAVLQKLAAMGRAGGVEAYVRQARALQRRRDQQATLRRLSVPCWIVCGEADTLMTSKRHEAMAQMMPNASLTVLQGVGHLPTLEAPARISDLMQQWLKSS